MRGVRRIFALAFVTSAFFIGSLIAPSAASAAGSIDVLLSGLSSPKGLSLSPFGLVIGQGTFGPPGPVLEYTLHGPNHGQTAELTGPENVVDVATGADGSGWAIGGDQNLYRKAPGPDGAVSVVLNIPEYQQADPDPYDQDGDPSETNPYGLTVLPSGDALVADAANNDLIRVTPGGDATTVARFDLETVSTDHLGPDSGLPPEITAESVPTSVTLGPDGSVYVGELKGFPFRPGSSRIWKVDPDLEGALCSVNTPDPRCTTAWAGLTAIQDITYDIQTGTLYVYELAKDGVGAFEAGFESGDFPPAVLLEVKKNKTTELAAGQLSEPGGIVATNRGHVYVTDGVFSDGRLIEVHR
jgi:hypothetical protein